MGSAVAPGRRTVLLISFQTEEAPMNTTVEMNAQACQPAIDLKDDGVVLMRLYPKTNILIAVARPAALHLFSLVCRYSATIAKRGWSSFWPRISQLERTMTVLFVTANGEWGRKLPTYMLVDEGAWWSDCGDDFRAVEQSGRRISLTDDVRKELITLYRVHLCASMPKDKVNAVWEAEHPRIVELLKRHDIFNSLLEGDRCYDDEYLHSAVYNLLLKHGHGVVQGDGEDHEMWCRNDASLFAECLHRHV